MCVESESVFEDKELGGVAGQNELVYLKVDHKLKFRTRKSSFHTLKEEFHPALKLKAQNYTTTTRDEEQLQKRLYKPLKNRISLQDIHLKQVRGPRDQSIEENDRSRSRHSGLGVDLSRKSRSSSMNKDLSPQRCNTSIERSLSQKLEDDVDGSCQLHNYFKLINNRYSVMPPIQLHTQSSIQFDDLKMNRSVRGKAGTREARNHNKLQKKHQSRKYADLFSFVEERESIHKEKNRISWISDQQIEQLKQFYDGC